MLTWWQGGVTPSAYGLGEGVIADSSYRTLRTVKTGNGDAADIHEFVLTPAADALFTIESPILVHLPGTPSVQLSPLLTRSPRRSTRASGSWSGASTGRIAWTLGGKASTFALGRGARFYGFVRARETCFNAIDPRDCIANLSVDMMG